MVTSMLDKIINIQQMTKQEIFEEVLRNWLDMEINQSLYDTEAFYKLEAAEIYKAYIKAS